MPIEWPGGISSNMSVTVEDNSGAPISILDADVPFNIKITWKVPAAFAGIIAGSSFRLRAYAESIGPGDEKKLGPDVNVAAHPPLDYEGTIPVAGSVLEGENTNRSGVYKIVAVLQHVNGAATVISGFAEAPLRMFRLP